MYKRKYLIQVVRQLTKISFSGYNMVYCAVAGCYNHSDKKNTTEKISYFRPSSDKSLRRTWLSKIKRLDLPANYDSIRVCHVYFEEDQFQRDLQVCGFLYLSIKILPSFISFHSFNVWK